MNLMDQLASVVGEKDASVPVPYYLKTSLPNINQIISGDVDKGFPGGRIITIAGPESCGKTALATELMAECQRLEGFSFFEDFEHAFHHPHAAGLGLECGDGAENWFYKKPATAEEGFGQVYKILQVLRASQLGKELPKPSVKDPQAPAKALRAALKGLDLRDLKPICGVMDSIASMIPEEADIDYEDQNMKTKNMAMGMMLSTELKRLARDADDTGATMILLNQLRTNPGVMFGDNSTEPGGNAPRFYASLQIRLRRVDKWYSTFGDKKSEILGDVVEMYIRKNKINRPFLKTKYVFRTSGKVGLDKASTMILLGKEAGVLGPVTGTTVEFNGKKRYGINQLWEDCQKDEELMNKLVDHVMSKVHPTQGPAASEDEDDKTIPVVSPKGAFEK